MELETGPAGGGGGVRPRAHAVGGDGVPGGEGIPGGAVVEGDEVEAACDERLDEAGGVPRGGAFVVGEDLDGIARG